ncbi:hypothetical protein BZG36_01605 [Bifiguratus adelaidae]|uniref:PRELI/MSF1 domain-containing protein n=1 Tax=Bifiguratus adelaidae TaxID=1938954 RepID=A0A261Y4D2_9FUNG|nr:hypothetical protein BZG36_01605 [Bifiguratus adelaidae]
MKLFTSTHQYPYKWSLVSAAQWQKYPNEHCPHVKAVDVLSRHIDKDTGILYTERLLTVEQNVPAWVMRFIGGCTTQYVREVSALDPKTQTLTMSSVNLTMSNFMSVQETITYQCDPDQPDKTLFSQTAAISAGSTLRGMASMVEDFSVKRFKENAVIGREGFMNVLERFSVLTEASEQATLENKQVEAI